MDIFCTIIVKNKTLVIKKKERLTIHNNCTTLHAFLCEYQFLYNAVLICASRIVI